jgi:2,3-dihydroxybiphenyl 1,2-dioxygenase
MSVFGHVALGYLVVETARFADWRRFGRDAIGMHLDELDADALRFRLDEQQCRFLLRRGPAEDVTTLGWQVDDHETFDEILRRVHRCGVPVTVGADEEAALRGVERLVRIPGPNGLGQELYTRAHVDGHLSVAGKGFVTGEFGLGHVAVTSTRPHQVRGYYNTLLDARLSDFIDETMSGVKVKIRFLRVNRRHHSVAIAALNRLPVNPIRTRVQHLNIQVAELDDLTDGYQRVRALGFDMALGIGQHTNDRELSFYAVTPSGFEWEVGWNPLVVDESTWKPTTHQGISIWGHEMQTSIDKLGQITTAARSLLHREEAVPALAGAGIPD